jgi:hypothetical protein
MEPWLAILIIVAAVASRPIEVRLWRAGRLSDRTLTLLLVGRFPVVLGLYALLTGGLSLLTLFVIASSLLPSLLLLGSCSTGSCSTLSASKLPSDRKGDIGRLDG